MILVGDNTWLFTVRLSGYLGPITGIATWFGGDDDPQDSGNTASGYPTKGHPDLLGCSLPMDFGIHSPATRGAPFPRLPWGIDRSGKQVPTGAFASISSPASLTVPLIDIGPGKQAVSLVSSFRGERYMARAEKAASIAAQTKQPHIIDLTQAAFKAIGGDLNHGVINVTFTVISLAQASPSN